MRERQFLLIVNFKPQIESTIVVGCRSVHGLVLGSDWVFKNRSIMIFLVYGFHE
ncbi:hypothetical protein HanXRQr2_Chr04g0148861 [Helianthus annuus]|uniref:Uncharacterized protein n=1 Tax=Helianthus annuus TaxID=4232 RepID=A0A9K3J5E9_HELAN|nr:hypothetical protein HanXRQr2_Chr04g0148861 [Helianthus annuus]